MLDMSYIPALVSLLKEVLQAGAEKVGEESADELLKASKRWFGKTSTRGDPFAEAVEAYCQRLEERYNTVRVFGMDQPVLLRTIFVRVNILRKISSRQSLSIQYFEKLFERDRLGFGSREASSRGSDIIAHEAYAISDRGLKQLEGTMPVALLDLLNEELTRDTYRGKDKFINMLKKFITPAAAGKYQRQLLDAFHVLPRKYMVLGKPGAGKTTFLKSLILQSLDGKVDTQRIPVFVSLKDLSDSGLQFMDYVARQFDICGFSNAAEAIEKMLMGGKCLLLLDGLDEIGSEAEEKIVRDLLEISDKYSRNQIVISCRTAAYNSWFTQYNDVEIADFDDTQIKNFIWNWFGTDRKTAKLCWKQLQESPGIKELAATPLLLTLLCLAFDNQFGFPANRAELYKEAIDALLKKWDASRRIRRAEVYKSLSLRRKESLLATIAADSFERGQYFFPTAQLESQILDFISNCGEPTVDSPIIEASTVLKAIESQHGLLVERAKGIYSFSHLTLQEYFTARHIADHVHKGSLEKLVRSHISDDRWREVFLLCAGILDSADDLLTLMSEWLRAWANEHSIAHVLANIDTITIRFGEYPPNLSRSLGMVYYLHHVSTLAADESVKQTARMAMEYGVATANLLAKEVSKEAVPSVARRLAQRIDLSAALHREASFGISSVLSKEKVPSSLFSWTDLFTYLKCTALFVSILRTDCYATRSLREELLKNVLLPLPRCDLVTFGSVDG